MFAKIIRWIKSKLYRRKMKRFIKYYRSRPDKFCEEFLEIKLYSYQKKILRDVMKGDGYNY